MQQAIWVRCVRYARSWKDADMRSSLVTEHKAIIEAVCSRDSDKAVRYITEHIDNQQRAINASIEAASED